MTPIEFDLKQKAMAASAIVLSYTPATIKNITREEMVVCHVYQQAAVPGRIVGLFDQIERLKAVEESVIAMARMLNAREWAEHVGKGAAAELESAITKLHNELVEARATADGLAGQALVKPQIELNAYQLRALLEIAESGGEDEDDPVILVEGDGHGGPGLYAYWRECPEEGSSFIGVDDEDQQRANKLAESFEAEQEVQP